MMTRIGIHGLLIALAGSLILTGCGDDSISPADRLSVRSESEHYVYFHSEGDAIDPVLQERYHEWLLPRLGIDPAEKLEYRKYRDRTHMHRLTGRTTNGFAEPGTVRFHTIWPFDNHEGVHVLVVRYMGHPPALFNEGLAVAHQGVPVGTGFEVRWNGRALDVIAAEALAGGTLPSLDAILESPGFFAHGESLMYPVGGSFTRYVLDSHGWTPMRAYLAASDFDDSATETRAAFRAAFGVEIDAVWAAWRASLQP